LNKANKIKSSIYYPVDLRNALIELQKKDSSGRTINQIAIDIMLENVKIQEIIKKLKNEHTT